MSFELEPDRWERAARTVERLADGLRAPLDLPLPDDRYARALGAVPAASDAAARGAHRAAVAELRDLAARIRGHAHATCAADDAGAQAIGATR